MEHLLRLLIVDDQQPDAELSAGQIARGGYPCTWRRVETEAEFRVELREFAPDLILSDWLWVARERSLGDTLVFYPTSSALGSGFS